MNIKEAIKELFNKHNIDPKEFVSEDPKEEIQEESTKVEFDREKFEDVALLDGTVIMVEPALEVGAQAVVMDGETPVPVPAGEYELSDGRILVVEEAGLVSAINEVSEEVEDAPVEEEEMNKEESTPEREAKKVIESVITEKQFNEMVEKFTKEIAGLTDALSEEKRAKVEFMQDVKDLLDQIGDEPKEEPKEDKFKGFGKKKDKNYFIKQN